MAEFLYTIVEEHYFRLQLRKIKRDAKRAEEFLEGAKWILSRAPDAGMKVADDVWFLPNDVPGDVPVNLYYTFDEDHVYLLRIEIAGNKP